MNPDKNKPIGFMDSGLGGISVLREAVKLMPGENFIYFGDSANVPYGNKPREEIRRLTFRAVDILMEYDIKGLAIACNTATSAAVKDLRIMYPDLPLVGIEPAIKPAIERSRGGRILVMATPMTIKQEKFRHLLETFGEGHDIVSVPCDGLVSFVENCMFDQELLNVYFKKHLSPFVTNNTESIVLGCTHYPFLKSNILEFLKERHHRDDIVLIDGSFGTARELKRRLNEKGLLKEANGTPGHVEILNSSSDSEMVEKSYALLHMPEI
ncbi:MAG: glutamate racemase [Lachnospiraceae bacterium]|nr:glutamate racemase [Lachnospiraceae bacterium]